MTHFPKLALPAALVGAVVIAGAAPAAAAGAMPKQPALSTYVEGATLVAAKKKRGRHVRRYYREYGNEGYAGSWGGGWNEPYDTVGSVGYNGTPYGYNRFSGQQYNECVIDLGYGRVQACGGNVR